MECFEPLKGFEIMRQACDQLLRDRDTSTALEKMFAAVRAFDDHLDYIAPREYTVPGSNVTARAGLQSLQWSLYPVSVLRRTKTAFRYLRNSITFLAETVLKEDHARLDRFHTKVTQLEELLENLDTQMQKVYPSDAPYVTSLFVQLHHPHCQFKPLLDTQVMR
jgi:hypothetical protein